MGPGIFAASQKRCRRLGLTFGESALGPSRMILMPSSFPVSAPLATRCIIFESEISLSQSEIGSRTEENFLESALATSFCLRRARSPPGLRGWAFWKARSSDLKPPALRFRKSGGTVWYGPNRLMNAFQTCQKIRLYTLFILTILHPGRVR